MKTVTWNNETQMIPGIGIAKSGESIDLPDEMADEFVQSGKASSAKKKSTANKVNTNEEESDQ